MKIIELEYETEIWELPLKVIAGHRASYYKKKDGSDWQEEFDFVMEDDVEGIDWITNNMHLEEFEDFVKKTKTEKDIDWINPVSSRIKDVNVGLNETGGENNENNM